jgi:hypothetical protein
MAKSKSTKPKTTKPKKPRTTRAKAKKAKGGGMPRRSPAQAWRDYVETPIPW